MADTSQDFSFSPDSPLFAKRVNDYDGEVNKLLEYLKQVNKSMYVSFNVLHLF